MLNSWYCHLLAQSRQRRPTMPRTRFLGNDGAVSSLGIRDNLLLLGQELNRWSIIRVDAQAGADGDVEGSVLNVWGGGNVCG